MEEEVKVAEVEEVAAPVVTEEPAVDNTENIPNPAEGEGINTSDEVDNNFAASKKKDDEEDKKDDEAAPADEGKEEPSEEDDDDEKKKKYAKKDDEEDEDKKGENSDAQPEDKKDEDEKKKKYELLETEFSALQEKYSELEVKYNELVAFKAQVEDAKKDEMIAKFTFLSDEDKKDVIENKSKYTIDEIEAKLSIICVRNKVNFDLDDSLKNDIKTEEPIRTFNLTDEGSSTPAFIKAILNNRDKK